MGALQHRKPWWGGDKVVSPRGVPIEMLSWLQHRQLLYEVEVSGAQQNTLTEETFNATAFRANVSPLATLML